MLKLTTTVANSVLKKMPQLKMLLTIKKYTEQTQNFLKQRHEYNTKTLKSH